MHNVHSFFFLFYYIHNSLADCECKSVNTLWNGTWVIIEGKDLHLYLVGGYQNLLKKKREREQFPTLHAWTYTYWDLKTKLNMWWIQVTKHEDAPESEWRNWNWRSEGDLMLNGAYFRQSGAGASSTYARASSLNARPSTLVGPMTMRAGALNCRKGSRCWS